MNIEFGVTARDRITGFSGVITGRTEYISGCTQILLVPQIDKDGKLVEGVWFDAQRLEVLVGLPQIILNNGATPGPDRAPPRRI